MKIYFSKLIITDESPVRYDGQDGWTEVCILYSSDMPVAKENKYNCGILWATIVDETIIRPFKINERNKQRFDFMNKIFFCMVQVLLS